MAELHIAKGYYDKACEIYQNVMQGDYYFLIWKTYANCLIVQKMYKEALDLYLGITDKLTKEGKTRFIPEEFPFYKENLELAISGDADATERIMQKASDALSSLDWQNQEN
jgi:tetratricopeptide (TPR) repeat protein